MNLDHAIGTIISRRFTERQARFLVLVARHSGVCIMRQYSAFAGGTSKLGEPGGNPDAVSDDDERAHRAGLRRFSGLGFSALYPLWAAHGDDVFPSVAARAGDVSSNRWCCRTPTVTWRRWWVWRSEPAGSVAEFWSRKVMNSVTLRAWNARLAGWPTRAAWQ
jgi:hypothetical protein